MLIYIHTYSCVYVYVHIYTMCVHTHTNIKTFFLPLRPILYAFNLFGKGNLEKVQNFKSIWQHFGANKPWTPSSVSTRLPAKILSNLWRYAARRFRGCVWTVILWLLPLSTQCHTNRKHSLLESGGKKNVALHYFGPHHFPLHSDLYSPRLQPAKGSGKGYVELSFFPPFSFPPQMVRRTANGVEVIAGPRHGFYYPAVFWFRLIL